MLSEASVCVRFHHAPTLWEVGATELAQVLEVLGVAELCFLIINGWWALIQQYFIIWLIVSDSLDQFLKFSLLFLETSRLGTILLARRLVWQPWHLWQINVNVLIQQVVYHIHTTQILHLCSFISRITTSNLYVDELLITLFPLSHIFNAGVYNVLRILSSCCTLEFTAGSWLRPAAGAPLGWLLFCTLLWTILGITLLLSRAILGRSLHL